jgi:hypothetical protein
MRVYISGGITHNPNALQDFNSAEQYLIGLGHEVVNPMKLEHSHDKSWENYMKVDIREMMLCDALYVLHGWRKSKGARIEVYLAEHLKMKIIYQLIDLKKYK